MPAKARREVGAQGEVGVYYSKGLIYMAAESESYPTTRVK